MRIAIIGNGIIGYAANKYLNAHGYKIDLISPDFERLKRNMDKKKFFYLKNNNYKYQRLKISPKFFRKDILFSKTAEKVDSARPEVAKNTFDSPETTEEPVAEQD